MVSTQYGRQFYNLLPDDIEKPDLTALWWTIQEDIKSGNAKISDMTDSVLASICKHLQDDYSAIYVERVADSEEIGKCPLCREPVYENKLSFACSGYKDGCKFVIWKENGFFKHFGKKVTIAAAKSLLSSKHRHLENGLISSSGKSYKAYFVMTVDHIGQTKFSMEFPDKKETTIKRNFRSFR